MRNKIVAQQYFKYEQSYSIQYFVNKSKGMLASQFLIARTLYRRIAVDVPTYLILSHTHVKDLFLLRSTNNTEAIRLDPLHSDYEKMCGNKLEFQIIPGKANKEGETIEIVAENVDLDGYDNGEGN